MKFVLLFFALYFININSGVDIKISIEHTLAINNKIQFNVESIIILNSFFQEPLKIQLGFSSYIHIIKKLHFIMASNATLTIDSTNLQPNFALGFLLKIRENISLKLIGNIFIKDLQAKMIPCIYFGTTYHFKNNAITIIAHYEHEFCNKNKNKISHQDTKPKNIGKKLEDTAEHVVTELKDTAEHVVTKLEDTAEEVKDNIGHAAEEAKGGVQQTVEKVGQDVKNAFEQFKDKFKDIVTTTQTT